MYGCTKRGLNETTTCYHTSDHGYSYRGRVNTTIGNLTCQRWNSSFPNNHYFSPSDITAAGLEDNYCRNPDMSDMPWCYVTNSNKIWEYCNITACPPNVIFVSEPGSYRGNRNVTTSGEPCKHWNQTSYRLPYTRNNTNFPNLNNNYCRNPNRSSVPWCFSALTNRSETCNVSICNTASLSFVNDTGCVDPKKPQTYRGIARTTVSGKTCQFWMSQYPNKIAYPGALKVRLQGLRENYCRSTSSNMWPGCYPASFGDKWEPCAIPLCSLGAARIEEPDCYYARDRMSYLGTVNVTRKGVACQRWDTFTPHMHKYIVPLYRYLGAHNYCRNPDLDARGPWCFTMDHHRRKDYCKVPRC
uniref:Kringle domain-containing protein n=1 Tax=Ciona intestinalis TaxID=7719 RepID=H2XJQ9_CIOIN